jgi:hypothetical protein
MVLQKRRSSGASSNSGFDGLIVLTLTAVKGAWSIIYSLDADSIIK